MTFDEQELFYQKKVAKYYEQNGKCFVCEKKLYFEQAQWAHIIPATKAYLKRFGLEIIHHEKNGRICCAKCNQKVLMDPKTNPVSAAEHVAEIREDLNDT